MGEVVPKAMFVPLSNSRELAVVELPVYLTRKLFVPVPPSLLLKVKKSVPCNWPVLTALAKGRLRVRELLEVEILKMLPAVPVETVVITLEDREMEVEVPIKTFWPPAIDRPEPTVKSPKVVVPMPPLAVPMTPLIPMVEVPVMAMLVP